MWECFLGPGMRRDVPILAKMSHPNKGMGQLGKTRKGCMKVCLDIREGWGPKWVSTLCLQQRWGGGELEYPGRTEYVAPISKMKEMGLPATFKITQGSAVMMVRDRAVLEPDLVSY